VATPQGTLVVRDDAQGGPETNDKKALAARSAMVQSAAMRHSRLLVQVTSGVGIAAAAVAITLLVTRPSRQAALFATQAEENRQLRAQLEQSRAVERATQAERAELSSKYEELRRLLDERGIPLLPWPERRSDAGQDDNINLRGVIKETRTINQTLYGTISIGSAHNVQKGMRFKVVNDGNFLGYLTVDFVDAGEAVGHMDGPSLNQIRKGSEVRTQW
jgi:hypothetical protein